MKTTLAIFLVLTTLNIARSEEHPLADSDEKATWQWLLQRANATEHIERDRNGRVKWVGFYDPEKEKGDYYRGSLTLNEQGHTTKLTFNNANFSNQDFKRLAIFKRATQLTAWHNGWNKKKDEDKSVYSGAGLIHLKNSAITHFNIGGSWFNDEGLMAANQLPNLRELKVYHTRVTNIGVEALRDNPHLIYLNLGPQFSQKINDDALAAVSSISNLEKLDLNEMLLTWEGGLKHLVHLDKLKQLTLKQSYLSVTDLALLRRALPDVEILYEEAAPKFVEKMKSQKNH